MQPPETTIPTTPVLLAQGPMASQTRPLLLAGGKSTRMGRAKHLLEMPDGRPVYMHQIDLLQAACPEAPVVYVSLALDSIKDAGLYSGCVLSESSTLEFIYDLEVNETARSAGPAAGLLAAYQSHPDSTWLVLACDYPLMTLEALRQLQSSYMPPVTCFRNAGGFPEPLVGLWGPEALERLKQNHAKGRSSPSSVVRELGSMLTPDSNAETVLRNVNIKKDWEETLEMMADAGEAKPRAQES